MKPGNAPLLILLTGPTASGKTAVSVELAEWLKTEILSADSRQFYRELVIGSAMPEPEILRRVPHHFIGHLSIQQPYNVSMYEQDALARLDKLFETHTSVLLTGGSGLYLDALCHGIDHLPDPSPELRSGLQQQWEESGLDSLLEQLQTLDPDYFAEADKNNPKRILRALEVCLQSGLPYSSFRKRQTAPRPFRILKICLDLPRAGLHERINRRTDEMFDKGLQAEAEALFPFKHLNALNTVGYKELFEHFKGFCSIDQAREKIKTNTRRYAKRQLTWFRKDNEYKWLHPSNLSEIKNLINQQI